METVPWYLLPSIAMCVPILGRYFSKQSLKEIQISESLSDKLNKYQRNLLLKYSFFEGPSIVSSVVYFLTGDTIFLVVCALLFLLFLTQNPTKSRIVRELPLTASEELQLGTPEAKVVETIVKD